MKSDSTVCVRRLLQQQRLLPAPDNIPPLPARSLATDENLLPLLHHAWERQVETVCTARDRRAARRVLRALASQMGGDAVLTWGMPGPRQRHVELSIGPRLMYWPRGIPAGELVGIVSSRMGRAVDRNWEWFAAMRGGCAQLDPQRTWLVSAEKTAIAPFLERCPTLFGVPLLQFTLPTGRETALRWLLRQLARHGHGDEESTPLRPACLSPPLEPESECSLPLRDRLVFAASERLVVLRMRPGGHVEELLRRRLELEGDGAAISLAVGPSLVPERLARQFPETCRVETPAEPRRPDAEIRRGRSVQGGTVVSLEQIAASGQYLTHWTRDAGGPWPDQSEADYLDSLLLGRHDTDHGACATLQRIVTRRKLLASGRAIRGGTKVVCFTSVPLDQIKSLRTFRSHRVRWDFEPYGICITRDWLERQGTREVCYGDASFWEQLDESARPYFQRRWAGIDNQIDWSVEREWRHVGDIDLTDLPPDAAWLFVPTPDEARRLCRCSPWPVVVLA